MQRSGYNQPPPPNSPPLHHPVPQHVSSVPQFRSPPPPQPQSQNQNGYGYGQQPTPGFGQQAFGGFMNDQTAQMGFQVASSGMKAGQQYMEQNVGRYISIPALKHYFNVSNSYVVSKLFLILFPFRHKPWTRKTGVSESGQGAYFLPPREDINSPDGYLPLMSFVTYILLSTIIAGLRNEFRPELLGATATTACSIVLVEVAILKLGCYLLSISNESQLLDLIAYSGYKFIGVIVTVIMGEIGSGGQGTGGLFGWIAYAYTVAATGFFLIRSMRYVLLPDNAGGNPGVPGADMPTRARRPGGRTQFLFFYAFIVQLGSMWVLSWEKAPRAVVMSS